MGDKRMECETPGVATGVQSGWPGAPAGQRQPFDFLGESGLGLGLATGEKKPSMPGTPVKKHAYGPSHGGGPFGNHRVGHSISQPTLGSDSFDGNTTSEVTMGNNINNDGGGSEGGTVVTLGESTKVNVQHPRRRNTLNQPPPSTKKPLSSVVKVPHVTLTMTSPPDSPCGIRTEQSSPTVRLGPGLVPQVHNGSVQKGAAPPSRVGLLRPLSSGAGSSDGSEEEGTPTKGGGERMSLASE